MYNDYFGLNQAPFRITPDTALFYTGGSRGDVLDALVYAITSGEGIVKVVGEVGTGKTMLCRMLEERLPDNVQIAYLANPSLTPQDILHAVALELELDLDADANRLQVMHRLQETLLSRHANNHRVVVLVEEAQSMPVDTLEEIRLLSNLETKNEKLLQIVLFGQPELDDNLARPEIRQLRERITHSFALTPLARHEVQDYVAFRLRASGYRGRDAFTAQAYRAMSRASEGLTRRVNIIADKAMLAAFADDTHDVSAKHVKSAIADSEFSGSRSRAPRLPAIAMASGVVMLAAAAGWYAGNYAGGGVTSDAPAVQELSREQLALATPAAQPAPESLPESLPESAPKPMPEPARDEAVRTPPPMAPVTPAAAASRPLPALAVATGRDTGQEVAGSARAPAMASVATSITPPSADNSAVSSSTMPAKTASHATGVAAVSVTDPVADAVIAGRDEGAVEEQAARDSAASIVRAVPTTASEPGGNASTPIQSGPGHTDLAAAPPTPGTQGVVARAPATRAPLLSSASPPSQPSPAPAPAGQGGAVARAQAVNATSPIGPQDAAVASSDSAARAQSAPVAADASSAVSAEQTHGSLLEWRLAYTRQWLRGVAKDRYSIQLLATDVAQQQNLEAFLSRRQRAGHIDQVFVYRTRINARQWFGVLFGEFAGYRQAREALRDLPRELQIHQPFIRNIKDINTLG